MLRILGIPLHETETRRIIATLVSDGSPAAMSAAAMLTKGLERDLFTVGLTPVERDAILLSPEEAPTNALGELRGKLMRDHAERLLLRSSP